ncbi:MAG: PP2C family protein-serine/threonine phosphatase [bacterium]
MAKRKPAAVRKDILLIVDDEEDIRLNLCDFMALEGFDVLSATNGAEAFKILKDQTPDVILTDLIMPHMGGLELLEKLHQKNLDIPVVIMTAFGTIDYAVKAMKVGARDFITKPIDYDYVLKVIHRVLKNARLEQKIKEQQQEMDEDLHLAGRIQNAILPKPIDHARYSLNYRFEPLLEIGGDRLLVHEYGEDHLSLALFDVSGHGVSAALVANLVHIELVSRLCEDRPPFNVIEHLQRFVHKTLGEAEIFFTIIIADVNLFTHTLTVCNAGHPDLLVWKYGQGTLERIHSHIPPVGFPSRAAAESTETRMELAAGDRIILYTDGFPEIRGKDGQILGYDRFTKLVQKKIRLRAIDFLDQVFQSIDSLCAGEMEDDRTLALVEIK